MGDVQRVVLVELVGPVGGVVVDVARVARRRVAVEPPELSEYCWGWREASVAKVVTPTPASAAGMLGLSTPECSPVTTAAGL